VSDQELEIDQRFKWAVDLGKEILGETYKVVGSSFDSRQGYGVAFMFPNGRRRGIRIAKDGRQTMTPESLRAVFEAVKAEPEGKKRLEAAGILRATPR
jgi:hypothetical protein